ncbi:MAG: SPFH domain-containing protein [Anaerolineae bacterium]|nr:SPFH domain-containing protein [Thermoflexales bacterium]MCX7940130.1 SPFH domain-containing protein [Thermoflexales bacterium]MDW8054419.1 SPFH domain-containing protein [Anaerolineae bacterium]
MPRILDVIEWPDQGPNDIVKRVPEAGAGDIRLGSQLIVRPSQAAVFFRDGKALDTFTEGRHTLTTANLPLLSSLIGLVTDSRNPFPAEVYFVATKEFVDMKWGTPNEITMPDSVLGMVQLRAFGTYSMQIKDPQRFVSQVVGAQGIYTTAQINDYLRSIMVSEFASVLGMVMKARSLLDLAALQADLGAALQAKAADDFEALGIALKKAYVVSIQPSEETAKAIATRSAMGAVGVNYMQYQAGQAMREAARNEGQGLAALGAGAGAGLGIGQALSQAMAAGMQQPVPQPPSSAAPTKAQIRQALTNLDIRFANGEINEETYNRLRENLSKALESAAE